MAEVFSGARAKLIVDGAEIGFATGVSASEQIQLQRVDVLGNIDSQEIVPVGRVVSVQADFVRITNQSLNDLGIMPRGGTTDVINFPEITLEVYDQISDVPVWRVEGARCESRSWQVQSGSIVTANASFQARRLYDERG
tara:strand:- start:453 stop:869 length:417 start_codon:yes stop_codon:yes gene_type:complete